MTTDRELIILQISLCVQVCHTSNWGGGGGEDGCECVCVRCGCVWVYHVVCAV